MNELTKLEKAVIRVLNIKSEDDFKKITQDQLDKHANKIMNLLSAKDLIQHTRYVYNKTVSHFNNDPHITEGVIDTLILFVDQLNEGDFVCDIGCGNGRDLLFMATKDIELRKKMMQRISYRERLSDRFLIPTQALEVVGLDVSEKMIEIARKNTNNYIKTFRYYPMFIRGDMHAWRCCDELFNGIWSCTSLLVHTPKSLIEPSIKKMAKSLTIKGKLGLCYIQEQISGQYNKLFLSSTGNIKYFSQPRPGLIKKIAEKYGLKEIFFGITDYEIENKLIQKNFFANHIFEK